MKLSRNELADWLKVYGAWVLVVLLVAIGTYSYIYFRGVRAELTTEKAALAENVALLEEERARLEQELGDKIYIIESFDDQISSISGVVGNLQKLKDTDEELLRKYSKVSFLNENYVPSELTEIDEEYALVSGDTDMLIHAKVWPYLEELLEEAREDGVGLFVSSAFRSFGTQGAIKSSYTVLYGAGTANQFSAEQGFSEHQLGTTADFATRSSGAASRSFETDLAYKWLQDNAHKYGFVLSYPKGNSYYIFEPWHWRFVGVDLARDLHEDGEYFYNLDQREIDEYLIKLFD